MKRPESNAMPTGTERTQERETNLATRAADDYRRPDLPPRWEWWGGEAGEHYYLAPFGRVSTDGSIQMEGAVSWTVKGEGDGVHRVVICPPPKEGELAADYPVVSASFSSEAAAFEALPGLMTEAEATGGNGRQR